MKHVFYLLLFCFSVTTVAQTANPDNAAYSKKFLSMTSEKQEFTFRLMYGFAYYRLHQDPKAKNTLQIAKPAVKDTMSPFFNKAVVNAQTVTAGSERLAAKSACSLFNSASVSGTQDLKTFKSNVRLNISGFPYYEYLTIAYTITAATDASGINRLVKGTDTLNGNGSILGRGENAEAYLDMIYDNTGYPETLTITGTAQIMVPTAFEIITFSPTELNTPKVMAGHSFVLRRYDGASLMMEATGAISKSDIYFQGFGPGNIRYECPESGFLTTDSYITALARDHSEIQDKELHKVYLPEYLMQLKNNTVQQLTYFQAQYRGSLSVIYIVKPTAFYTVSVPFTILAK